MQKRLHVTGLLLTFLLCKQVAMAQVHDTVRSQQNAVIIIKQLLHVYLLQELPQSASYKKIQLNKPIVLLKDSSLTDPRGKIAFMQMKQIKNSSIGIAKAVVTDAGYPKQPLQQQFAKMVQTQQVKNIFSQFTGMMKKPALKWQGGSVGITGQTAPCLFNSGTVFINNNILNSSWTVLGIPMGLQFSRQDFTGTEYYSRTVFSFQFNREAYLNSLRDKIKLKIKASDLLPDYHDALQKIKENVVGRLKTSLDSINGVYKGLLGNQLAQLGDLQNLLQGDVSALQDKLLSAEFLQNTNYIENQLAQLQRQVNRGGQVDMALYDSLQQSVQSVTGIHAIINKVKLLREEVQESGLLDKLKQLEESKSGNIQQWMQQPDKLTYLVKNQLNLNGLQQLFLNMNRLQIGMNTISLSPLTVSQYVNNGINAEFVNNKTYLFIMAGKEKEFHNLYDKRFASSLFSTDNMAMGVRVGRGDLQKSHVHFSLFNYKQDKSSYGNNLVNVVPGKTLVLTFSNQLKMDEANYFNFEISRSIHQYDNESNISDTWLQGNSLPKQLPNAGNFMQQLAFTLQWNGEIKDRHLNYAIHGTRIGKGYNNPGSLFLSRGMTEFGGSIKKSLLKNQLQLLARGNFREYVYGISNAKWRNYNFSLMGKWKLKKGQYISLRYQPYQSQRWQTGKRITVGGSDRLSMDINLRKRFGKINYQHVISLSALKNKYSADSIPFTNGAVLISSLQTITIKKKSYYLNLQYNKATTPLALAVFNTQFNADAGIMYNLGKGVMASTALNYNSIEDWFKQVGIRQGISGQVGDKIIVRFYTDVLKNIQAYRPSNMGNIRMDWSLQYLIK